MQQRLDRGLTKQWQCALRLIDSFSFINSHSLLVKMSVEGMTEDYTASSKTQNKLMVECLPHLQQFLQLPSGSTSGKEVKGYSLHYSPQPCVILNNHNETAGKGAQHLLCYCGLWNSQWSKFHGGHIYDP